MLKSVLADKLVPYFYGFYINWHSWNNWHNWHNWRLTCFLALSSVFFPLIDQRDNENNRLFSQTINTSFWFSGFLLDWLLSLRFGGGKSAAGEGKGKGKGSLFGNCSWQPRGFWLAPFSPSYMHFRLNWYFFPYLYFFYLLSLVLLYLTLTKPFLFTQKSGISTLPASFKMSAKLPKGALRPWHRKRLRFRDPRRQGTPLPAPATAPCLWSNRCFFTSHPVTYFTSRWLSLWPAKVIHKI